jgi:tetratricopeptide (TPR) repeat protein
VTSNFLIQVLLSATLLQVTLTQEASAQEARGPTASDSPPVDDERARGLFEQGAAAYAAGHYEAALGFFEESYALSQRPTLLFNIGTSADRLRQNEIALENYEAYLAALPEAVNRGEVSSRVLVLREELAQQQRLESSLANLEAESTEDRSRRRRRRIIGGIVGAVVLIGGVVLVGVLASGDRFDDYESNVIQTLRSPL